MNSFTIGTKKEMTQIFDKNGQVIPVTIIDINDVFIIGVRTEKKDGYNAVVLGKGKRKNFTKALKNQYKKLDFVPRYVYEFKVDNIDDNIEVGTKWNLNFDNIKSVDVRGITKGKGFAGVIKRWGFSGGPKTHGQSDRWRAPGSIGAGTTPGRVFKGLKMAGRMGGERKTIKNLKFVKFLEKDGLILIKGGIVGSKNSPILLKFS